MAAEGQGLVSCQDVVEPYGLVPVAPLNSTAVVVKCNAGDNGEVRTKGEQVLAAGRVPDSGGPIRAGRRQTHAVLTERQAQHTAFVAAQGMHLLAGLRIPDLH